MAPLIVHLDRRPWVVSTFPVLRRRIAGRAMISPYPAEVIARLAGAEVAIINKVKLDAATLAALPDLRLIAVTATGTDVVDGKAAAGARHLGAQCCGLCRHVGRRACHHAGLRAGARPCSASRRPSSMGAGRMAADFCVFAAPVRDLAGLRLGLVGSGAIAQAVADRARGAGARRCVRRPARGRPAEGKLAFEEVLATSDILSLHCPLTDETRDLLNARTLAAMKPGAIVINTARGALIDYDALEAALESGRLGGAGLDVAPVEPPPPGSADPAAGEAARRYRDAACRMEQPAGGCGACQSDRRQYRKFSGRPLTRRRASPRPARRRIRGRRSRPASGPRRSSMPCPRARRADRRDRGGQGRGAHGAGGRGALAGRDGSCGHAHGLWRAAQVDRADRGAAIRCRTRRARAPPSAALRWPTGPGEDDLAARAALGRRLGFARRAATAADARRQAGAHVPHCSSPARRSARSIACGAISRGSRAGGSRRQRFPAQVVTLAVSDVVGDVPQRYRLRADCRRRPTTIADAQAVLARYISASPIPPIRRLERIDQARRSAARAAALQIVVRAADALAAAARFLEDNGYEPVILEAEATGEARGVARRHARGGDAGAEQHGRHGRAALRRRTDRHRHRQGEGGPNQEYALALAQGIAGDCGHLRRSRPTPMASTAIAMWPAPMSMATQSSSWPTPASTSARRSPSNDAGGALGEIGALFVPGPTLTNVNDLRIILVDP